MKHLFVLIIILNALFIALIGCQSTAEGPNTWIDQPLDNDTFHLQPLTLQAHASDMGGIESLEFFVNDESQLLVSANGKRLEQAMMQWMPPGPGIYTISVKATNNQGISGMLANTTITITGEAAQFMPTETQIVVTEEPEKQELTEDQSEQLPEPPSGPAVIPSQTINCRSGPGIDYQVVAALGTNQAASIVGRLANNTWYVIQHPEKTLECWVSASIVQVSGSIVGIGIRQAPPLAEKPPAEETTTEEKPAEKPQVPPPADTSPPIVTSVYASPSTIFREGCTGDPQTTILAVEAMDVGGITRVEAAWTIGSKTGSKELTKTSGNLYQANLGPFNTNGTLYIYGSVIDGSSNWTPFTLNVAVKSCID